MFIALWLREVPLIVLLGLWLPIYVAAIVAAHVLHDAWRKRRRG
jgi:hypothetical protein